MSTLPSPTLTVPSLSDLLTVHGETTTTTHNSLFQQYLLNRSEAVIALMDGMRNQKAVLETAFSMFEHDRIADEVFLGSIDNNFAMVAGYRQFLLSAVQFLIEHDGPSSAEGRECLLAAEQELEAEMTRTLERVKESVKHLPYVLHWEEEKGFFLHKVHIASPGTEW